MKFLFAAILLCFATQFANAESAEVPGQLFYKMPAGNIVTRNVSLVVPVRGEGDVILKSEHHQITAHHFEHKEVHGRKIFKAMFMNPPGAPEGTCLVLTGTYLRGDNLVLYYGDMYQSQNGQGGEGMNPQYAGGFNFQMPLTN